MGWAVAIGHFARGEIVGHERVRIAAQAAEAPVNLLCYSTRFRKMMALAPMMKSTNARIHRTRSRACR